MSRIGAGGMGVVYRVQHLQLGKIAAMKVLRAETASDFEMIRRFRLEAQAVSRLNHPNIVQTFDFGQWDGALYLVMEYVKGEDLAAVLNREGPMSFPRAAKFFVQVCSALTEAHETGIIHRDLKPENLMLIRRSDGTEHAKVLDFGLAKLRERDDVAAITSAGQVVGTPYYMSPEQVRGESLDVRADLYSLGATLYRVLTGFPPFQASSPMGVLSKHLTDTVVPPRTRVPLQRLPAQADRIVLRAMAKSAADRYASAAEFQRDLEHALQHPQETDREQVVHRSLEERHHLPTTEAPTMTLGDSEGVDDGERLRRKDLDDFERSLRRRRRWTRTVMPLGVLGVLTGGVLLMMRATSETASTVEHEPNNTPGYANLLPAKDAVRGTIGALIEGGHSDVDYFRVPRGSGQRVVSARLEGIPALDLVLELFDAQGRRLMKSDRRGKGAGEWLRQTTIGPGEAYLLVREVWIEGGAPRAENVPTPYSLRVDWGAPETGMEIEPNDWSGGATTVDGDAVQGFLVDADDKDWFAITPTEDGQLLGTVKPPTNVDIVLLLDETGKKTINREGAGGTEVFALPAATGRSVLIGVARRGGSGGNKRETTERGLPGDDQPYELRSEVRR